MNTLRWVILAATGGLLGACGGGGNNQASFSITLEPVGLSIPQGSSADVLVRLSRQPGFTGEVTIALDGPPDGLYADTLTLPAQKNQGVLEIRVAPDAPTQGLTLKALGQSGSSSVAASLSLTVATAVPSSQDLIAQALQNAQIDYPTSVLYRAYALFGDPRLPQQYRSSGPVEEDAGFFFEASQPGLPPAVQAQLQPFLVRPTYSNSVFNQAAGQSGVRRQDAACPVDSGATATNWRSEKGNTYPIRVWLKCGTDPALDDYDLERARALIESIWKPMTDLMGPPIPDEGGADEGGDGNIDFYLLGSGDTLPRGGSDNKVDNPNILAYARSSPPYGDTTSSGYMVLRRERLLDSSFKSVAVHEFFHVLQKAYNASIAFEAVANGSNEFWYTEASAVWAQSHFARETTAAMVHYRFTGVYQQIKTSLHRSVASAETNLSGARAMYASYIYPFFMEQKTSGPDIVKQSWAALKTASGFDDANQKLDGVFQFKDNFRLFAVENYNSSLTGVLDDGKRYKALDPKFPDGVKPIFADAQTLSAAVKLKPTVDIAPLRAAYYKYPVSSDKIKKIIFNFEDITVKDGLDIDGLVKIQGKNWEKRDYTSQKEVKFCLDKPEEKLEDIILVLSNHNIPLDKFVSGNLKVEASTVPCGGSWSGTTTADFGYTMTADVTFNYDETRSTANLAVFTPSGTVSFTPPPSMGCVVSPGSHDISPAEGQLTIDFSTNPPTYKAQGATVWLATYTCNGNSQQLSAGGIWLGGNGTGNTASGNVTLDGNTIQGNANIQGFAWTWKLTKN